MHPYCIKDYFQVCGDIIHKDLKVIPFLNGILLHSDYPDTIFTIFIPEIQKFTRGTFSRNCLVHLVGTPHNIELNFENKIVHKIQLVRIGK